MTKDTKAIRERQYFGFGRLLVLLDKLEIRESKDEDEEVFLFWAVIRTWRKGQKKQKK